MNKKQAKDFAFGQMVFLSEKGKAFYRKNKRGSVSKNNIGLFLKHKNDLIYVLPLGYLVPVKSPLSHWI